MRGQLRYSVLKPPYLLPLSMATVSSDATHAYRSPILHLKEEMEDWCDGVVSWTDSTLVGNVVSYKLIDCSEGITGQNEIITAIHSFLAI